MKAIEQTYICLLADIAELSGFSEIRGSYEGLHWCLNEAPKLEKHILSVIEGQSVLDLTSFPRWLHRLVRCAVCKDSATHLRWLRQLLLFSYKSLVTHDKTQTEQAIESFIACNRAVGSWSSRLSDESPILLDIARRHCQSVLYRFREKALSPSHGPGASTTPKERWTHWYDSIESVYPCSDYMCLYFNQDHIAELDTVTDAVISARLHAVPKDTRGPRLICVHPAEAIWFQQGLRRELERAISLERSTNGPWPRGRVHFLDQSVNGKIALASSRSRRYATIDMKEASDRIPDTLVQILFGRKYKYFGCCRAQVIEVPDQYKCTESRIEVNSYAPMGNATTFPVQSLVFWSICVAAMQYYGFHQPGAVFVFGDDIIVPSECARVVIKSLESFGLVVNRQKTFIDGSFRESCGVDAFNGIDVTPVRWKASLDAENLSGMQSMSDIAMRLRMAKYDSAAACVYRILNTRLMATYGHRGRRWRAYCSLSRTNDPNHGGIAEYVMSASQALDDAFWHRDLHLWVSPVLRLKETLPYGVPQHGWNHVLESILAIERVGTHTVPDRRASRRVRLDRGWSPVLLLTHKDKEEVNRYSCNKQEFSTDIPPIPYGYMKVSDRLIKIS